MNLCCNSWIYEKNADHSFIRTSLPIEHKNSQNTRLQFGSIEQLPVCIVVYAEVWIKGIWFCKKTIDICVLINWDSLPNASSQKIIGSIFRQCVIYFYPIVSPSWGCQTAKYTQTPFLLWKINVRKEKVWI